MGIRIRTSRGRELNPKQAKSMGRLFIVVGILAVMFAIGWGVRSFRFQAFANRTTGTVVELREEEDQDRETTWYPVVEYEVDTIKYRIEGGRLDSWLASPRGRES